MMTGRSETERDLPQQLQGFEAAHAGHHHVEQDGVDAVRADDLQRRRAPLSAVSTV